GGQDEDDAGVILLYNYTGSTLLPGTRVSIAIDDDNVTINGIAWDETTENLAAVGYDETAQNGIIRIYHFDRDTASFTQLFATSVNAKYFGAVTWCGNGEFLTITDGLYDESAEGFVFVYQFNATKPSLTLTTSTEIANSRIFAPSWCSDCSYLATPVEVGGRMFSGYLQLFKANGSSVEAPTLYAKKNTFRFPSQLDIVNTIWWPAVTDAVAYNVYADANKTTLLKTVTQAPYTYVQHQIKPNTVTTYYVVSVDASGNESNVATISI
ncbi:MAG: hypothetical protein LUQ59_12550, partial [Methanothrix sp.]|nr:hypothetical protein [Methanothrix sp.]